VERLPALVWGVGAFLLGAGFGPFIEQPEWRLAGLVAGGVLILLGLALGDRRVRRRFSQLQPGRQRLSVVYSEALAVQKDLRAAFHDQTVSRTGWASRMSELDTRIFAVVEGTLPDHARAIRQGQRSFSEVHEQSLDDRDWAAAMLTLLGQRLQMLEEQLNRYSPE
jgi:hypothetical protein